MRITIRLNSLYRPLVEAAKKSGRSLSDEIRHRLARSLHVKAPEMEPGNPDGWKQVNSSSAPRVRDQNKG